MAVISNGFLIAYTSDIGKKISDDYGEEGRLWLFIVFEVGHPRSVLCSVSSSFLSDSMLFSRSCSSLAFVSLMYHEL